MKWPLPLTPIEELFFVDDRPDYPCCGFLRADFSGVFDQNKLESAIQKILPRHPLLTARVEDRDSRFVWVPGETPQPVIEWKLGSADEGYPASSHLDLRVESGVRFQVGCTGSTCTLFLQVHHAVCDGVGSFQFLHELLVEYAAASGTDFGTHPVLNYERWQQVRREMAGLPLVRQLLRDPRRLKSLWKAPWLLLRVPSALTPSLGGQECPHAVEGFPTTVRMRLSAEETAGLRKAARKLGVALNDLLVRDGFMACHEWRKAHDFACDEGWLRMAVPVNLRKAGEPLLPVSNRVSMVFLDRCDLNFSNPDALLASVHHELNRTQRGQMSHLLPLALALGRSLPGGLRKHLWAKKCLISSVCSNLGILFRRTPLTDPSGRLVAGEVRLDAVEVLPPIRPSMTVAFAVGTYAGRLWATLHYDPRPITPAQAQDLAETFHRRLLSSISSGK